MHGVLITFRSSASLDDLAGPFTEYGQALQQVPGLISKAWLQDGATVGGFHVFTDRQAADGYLNGSLFAGVTSNPAFSDFEIRHFNVLDDLSALTGIARQELAARSAPATT